MTTDKWDMTTKREKNLVCVYIYIYTHTQIYIYIYTHTHTHIYDPKQTVIQLF